MCSNVKSFEIGLLVHPAIMFMNSNKSEGNIRQLIQQSRQKCSMAGIALMNETIINKGPNRDIDRDAVNMLITRLISGQYDTFVVENMADITADESDLEEFMHDAANINSIEVVFSFADCYKDILDNLQHSGCVVAYDEQGRVSLEWKEAM